MLSRLQAKGEFRVESISIIEDIVLAFANGVAAVLPIDGETHGRLAALWFNPGAGAWLALAYVGAALGLFVCLFRDVARILVGVGGFLLGRFDAGARLFLNVLIICVPWIGASFLLKNESGLLYGGLLILGSANLVAAVVLIVADRCFMTVKRIEHVSPANAALLGVIQLIGFLPGIGRVTALVVGTRFLGMERNDGFRLVLLAQIPILLALAGSTFSFSAPPHFGLNDLALGFFAFVGVFLATHLARRWVNHYGLAPFALYRTGLGALAIILSFL